MEDQHKLSKYKQCFNQSQFFSTEVSSQSNLEPGSPSGSKNLFRIESKFTDDPLNYFRKVKDRYREAGALHQSALKNKIRAKSQLQRAQKDAEICRHEFLRMYMNKKFKLEEQAKLQDHQLDNQHYFRASLEKFKRRKVIEDLSKSLRKEKTQRNREEFLQKRKQEETKFRETFRISDNRIKQRITECHQRVSKDREQFTQRKRNLRELAETKSQFNYLLKINQEMKKIKEYQERLQQKQEEKNNPEDEERRILPRIFGMTFTQRIY